MDTTIFPETRGLTDSWVDSIDSLELGTRSRNALSEIKTINELVNLPPNKLISMRNMGEVGLKEIARALLMKGHCPKWLKEVAGRFSYPEAVIIPNLKDVPSVTSQGWNLISDLSNPYHSAEYWMLEKAIANLMNGKLTYHLCKIKMFGILLFRKGGVEMKDEPET